MQFSAGSGFWQTSRRWAAAMILGLLLCPLSLHCRALGASLPGIPPDLLITLQRGGCGLGCPSYTLELRADGVVVFDGRSGVRQPGQFRGQASDAALRRLVERIEAMGFFGLADEYGEAQSAPCAGPPDSRNPVVVWVRMGGRIKRVAHHRGCADPVTEQLAALEDAIDQAGQVARWLP